MKSPFTVPIVASAEKKGKQLANLPTLGQEQSPRQTVTNPAKPFYTTGTDSTQPTTTQTAPVRRDQANLTTQTTAETTKETRQAKQAKKYPFSNEPEAIYRPRVNPASINFDQEDPWLAKILNETWANLPENWDRNELANYPREALKAILFFLNQGSAGVSFNDQFLAGNQAAMMVVDQVRQEYANQDKYNQQVAEWYQRKAAYDKRMRQIARTNPLPFAIQPRVY